MPSHYIVFGDLTAFSCLEFDIVDRRPCSMEVEELLSRAGGSQGVVGKGTAVDYYKVIQGDIFAEDDIL